MAAVNTNVIFVDTDGLPIRSVITSDIDDGEGIFLLVKAVQELEEKNKSLEARLGKLEQMLKA